MEVSIIILTYNSSQYIVPLLTGLTKKYSKALNDSKLEIIIADNASHDDTVPKARKFDGVLVVENGGNHGFAKGNNLATKKAKGNIIIFINPDAKFVKGDVFDMATLFDEEQIGIVGGEILSWEGERELSCGKFYNAFNTFLLAVGLEEKLGVRFSPTRQREVDFVSGAFLAIRRSLFEKLHGFDEGYFMYIEDSDLCYRAKKAGYKTLFSPKATLQHLGQGSSNRTFAIVNIYKGLMYFNRKHGSGVSYHFVKIILKTKAFLLVMMGRIMNNKYLVQTYSEALKA